MRSKITGFIALTGVFVFSAFISTQTVLGQDESEIVGSKGCGMCHKPEKAQWDGHAHAAVKTECETCHGPGHKHAAAGPKTLRELKKEKKDMLIVVNKTSEACGECHSQTDDKSVAMVSDLLIQGQQQYTEMLYNKKAKLKMTCVMCHDAHASVTAEDGMKRNCLDCHKGKYKVEIKIAAMKDLSCESCHMPYADKGASEEKIGEYVKGDVRSHIFGITADPDYKLNNGGKANLNADGFARLTVEQTCYACHKTGEASDKSRAELLNMAAKIH